MDARTEQESVVTQVNPQHLWFMLLSTVRYSLHRQSTAPSTAVEMVLTYRNCLTFQQLQQIREEVETELRTAERHGRYVGHECDHKTWRGLVTALQTWDMVYEPGLG